MPWFIIIILSILFGGDLAWLWWSARKLKRQGISLPWRILHGLLIAAFPCALLWMMAGRFDMEIAEPPLWIVVPVYIWHLLILPVLVYAVMPLDAIWRIIRWTWRRAVSGKTNEPADPGEVLSRRRFIGALAVGAPALVALGTSASALQGLGGFRVRKIRVPIEALPSGLEGFRIAHVSDTHVGRFVDRDLLRKYAEAANALEADLVAVTGDILNDTLQVLPEAVEFLQSLKARHGLAICEGNHDLISSRAGFEDGMRAAGLPLLVNESLLLSHQSVPVRILGVRWGRGGERLQHAGSEEEMMRDNVQAASAELRDGEFPILLAHHPHVFDHAAGIPLTLSGHTHGGQLMLNNQIGAGPALFRDWSGAYQDAARHLVVSNGIGNWFPVRINAPAELIEITLVGV